MKLRYVALHIDSDSNYEDSFRYYFNDHSRFISNYLSIKIRKFKFETDGTFKMISICPSLSIKHICRIVGDASLQVRVLFNREAYEQMTEIEKNEYYLKLLEDGYNIASKHKSIPFENLLDLNQKFRQGGYINEWQHKRKQLKNYGIEVSLECSFTTQNFQLSLYVNNIKTKEKIVSGVIFTTEPDEICYQPLFKDIIFDDKHIIITEFLDKPKYIFKISDILNGNFKFRISKEGFKF